MSSEKCSYCNQIIQPHEMLKTWRKKKYHVQCFRKAKKVGLRDNELSLGYV